jgi:hypothetical protein
LQAISCHPGARRQGVSRPTPSGRGVVLGRRKQARLPGHAKRGTMPYFLRR